MSIRPKILIVADRCHWAYHQIQRFIVFHLSDEFDIYTDFILFYPLNLKKGIKHKLSFWKSCVKCWPSRRVLKKSQRYDLTVHLGYYYNRKSSIVNNTDSLIRGIFTDGFPPQGDDGSTDIRQFVHKYFSDVDAVVCGSPSIVEIYDRYVNNIHFANCSWESAFKRETPKTINTGSTFIVGWTGNPRRRFKGYYDYIVPAVEAAKKLRPSIELKTRFSGSIKTLPCFYNNVDVVLIASTADAGPSLFSEAAFSEIPSISTRIGHPAAIIDDGVNGIFVQRNILEMRNAIVRLYDDRYLLYKMSQQIALDTSKIMGTEIMKESWRSLFHSAL